MLNSIEGQLTYRGNERLFVSMNGLEWEIFTTKNSLTSFPDIGESIKVYTFVYHRDDQLKIYGFYDKTSDYSIKSRYFRATFHQHPLYGEALVATLIEKINEIPQQRAALFCGTDRSVITVAEHSKVLQPYL